jgi:DNA-binding CsgD family transcriptional regulator
MSSMVPADARSASALARDAAYPARALAAVARVHLANDAPELLESLMTAAAAIGASASLYAAAIPEGGTEPSTFSLFACDPGFAHRQLRLGSLQDHPWFRFARTRTTPATGREVQVQDARDATAIELARRHGFTSCLIVPTPAGSDLEKREVLCLGSDREGDFEGEDARMVWTLARALAGELHDWVSRHLSERLQQVARLKETDIALLKLEREGLSTKEIARRTGLSWASVDSRFQRVSTRLACTTRKAAAQRAAEYGLLERPAKGHWQHR